MRAFLLLSTFLFFGAAAQAKIPFLPVDNAHQDPSFAAFRADLQNIVAQKDHAALLKRVHNKIDFSFGGGFGKADFIEEWGLTDADAKRSGIWAESGEVLSLGGEFSDRHEFIAPYTFNNWPEGLDVYEHVIITGSGVNVRSQADMDGAILYRASHEILRLVQYPREQDTWFKVITPSGQTGFVSAAHARSPIDYRAIFEKNAAGEWLMRVFIAGD